MRIFVIAACLLIFSSCKKNGSSCNMDEVYRINGTKGNIIQGITGTVSFKEGNCMPSFSFSTSCKNCPVKRTMRIYEYTLAKQATPTNNTEGRFYDSFSTRLIKEVESDDNGFFQASLPAGKYTLVAIENGKLYSDTGEIISGEMGISPVTVNSAQYTISNFVIGYKAYY